MVKRHPFSDIGFAYAKRFADIEAAREQFASDRDACLARLAAALVDVLGESRSDFDVVGPHGENGIVYVKDRSSRYTAARKRRGKGGAAGVQLELGPLDVLRHDAGFGYVATAWFAMGRPQLRRLTAQIARTGGCAHALHGGYLYAWQTLLPIDETGDAFAEQAMLDAIAPTFDLYRRLDHAFAEHVDAEASDARTDDEPA